MSAIEELEKLASEWLETDKAGGGCPGCQQRAADLRALLPRLRTEERDEMRAAYVEGRVGNDVDSRPCNCKECLEIQAEAEAEAERRYP